MFLIIIIVILIISVWVLWQIYLSVFTMYWKHENIQDYQNSYYLAIWAIERWLLNSKYKKPSFNWSWWFQNDNNFGPTSDFSNDLFSSWNNKNISIIRELLSQCNQQINTLKSDEILTISLIDFDHLWDYEESTKNWTNSISDWNNISWYFSKINENDNITQWILDRKIENTTNSWFVIWSWNTNLDYNLINDNSNIQFTNSTLDPSSSSPIWNTLCNQNGCFTWQNISSLISWDEYLYIYTKQQLLSNTKPINKINYNFETNFDTNCKYYTIKWIWSLWNYIKEIQITKPTYNNKNPYANKFIFPYYN